MSDKPASPAAPATPKTPAMPASPLLPVPGTRLQSAPPPRGIIAGLAEPSRAQKESRAKATKAATEVRQSLATMHRSANSVRDAIKHAEGNEANAAEFLREGVSLDDLRKWLKAAETLLDEFMPPATPAAK